MRHRTLFTNAKTFPLSIRRIVLIPLNRMIVIHINRRLQMSFFTPTVIVNVIANDVCWVFPKIDLTQNKCLVKKYDQNVV